VVDETEQFDNAEENIDFPPEALNRKLIRPSARTTACERQRQPVRSGRRIRWRRTRSGPIPVASRSRRHRTTFAFCPPVRIETQAIQASAM
jgi:hypothetical protein